METEIKGWSAANVKVCELRERRKEEHGGGWEVRVSLDPGAWVWASDIQSMTSNGVTPRIAPSGTT